MSAATMNEADPNLIAPDEKQPLAPIPSPPASSAPLASPIYDGRSSIIDPALQTPIDVPAKPLGLFDRILTKGVHQSRDGSIVQQTGKKGFTFNIPGLSKLSMPKAASVSQSTPWGSLMPATKKESIASRIAASAASLKTPSLIKETGKYFSEFAQEEKHDIGNQLKGLWSGIRQAGHSLRHPSTIAQSIKTINAELKDPTSRAAFFDQTKSITAKLGGATTVMGGMAALKMTVLAGVGITGAPVLAAIAAATVTTAAVGGVLKSHSQYVAAKQQFEQSPENLGQSFGKFTSYLANNKRQLSKNFLSAAWKGAVLAGIGAGIGSVAQHFSGHDVALVGGTTPDHADAANLHANAQAQPAALSDAQPVAAAEAPPIHLSAVDAQALKDRAVELYNGLNGVTQDKEAALAMFRQAAEAGNHQAIRDLASITGEQVTQAAPSVTIAAPVATIAPDIQMTGPVPYYDALHPAPFDTLPFQAQVPLTEAARVESVLDMRANNVPVYGSGYIGLEKGTCFVSAQQLPGIEEIQRVAHCEATAPDMREGDYLRIVGSESGLSTAAVAVIPVGETISTNAFMNKLIGIKDTFNALLSAVMPQSVPAINVEIANDNSFAETTQIALNDNTSEIIVPSFATPGMR